MSRLEKMNLMELLQSTARSGSIIETLSSSTAEESVEEEDTSKELERQSRLVRDLGDGFKVEPQKNTRTDKRTITRQENYI